MFENPYIEKLAALKSGELAELVVEVSDFMTFREVWKEHPEKDRFVGEAGLNGRIIYRYVAGD